MRPTVEQLASKLATSMSIRKGCTEIAKEILQMFPDDGFGLERQVDAFDLVQKGKFYNTKDMKLSDFEYNMEEPIQDFERSFNIAKAAFAVVDASSVMNDKHYQGGWDAQHNSQLTVDFCARVSWLLEDDTRVLGGLRDDILIRKVVDLLK